jgi:predicted CDP-diglyceride synthetase/phosphatidate cytidylyltransferase
MKLVFIERNITVQLFLKTTVFLLISRTDLNQSVTNKLLKRRGYVCNGERKVLPPTKPAKTIHGFITVGYRRLQ